MTPEEENIIRKRQRSRALMTAAALVGVVVLLYLITIVRIGTAS